MVRSFGSAFVLLLLVFNTVQAASPQFAVPVNYSLATNYDQICVGDFNGDGKPDVAMIAINARKLLIMTNDGSGGLVTSAIYTCTNSPKCIAVGDFNGDGKLDIVVAEYSAGSTINVWLGSGNGLFPTSCVTSYAINYNSPGIAVGDFNTDGKLDLVLATYGPQILLGRGNGYFDYYTNYYIGDSYAVATGYFNNDTNIDLVTGNYDSISMAVCLGGGDGSFPTRATYSGASSEYHYAVAAADFNNDGWPDLVTANFYANSISLRTNNGSGAFGAQTNFSIGSYGPEALAVADFNGDGNLDIVTANYAAKGALTILCGNGQGRFAAAVTNFSGVGKVPPNQSIAVADFDGDGRPDIVSTQLATNAVTVLLNRTQPLLQASPVANGLKIVGPDWSGFQLECSTNLAAANSWTTVTNSWLVQGGQRYVVMPPAGQILYYRLGN
jgi:hypothetical protein